MTFGKKLFDLRKRNNMSQDELATKVDVSRQAISKWELDETLPESENIIKLADMFYVSADYLLNDNVEYTNNCKQYISVNINKYDFINLLAALASAVVSVIGFICYTSRLYWDYERYSKWSEQQTSHAIYYDVRFYEILDETVILVFLTIVITVSAITAYRLYKKCKSQINNQ